jgi:biotin carboxyl carrier protein
MDNEYLVDGTPHHVSLETREGKTTATIDGRRVELDIQPVRPGIVSLLIEGRSYLAHTALRAGKIFVSVGSARFCLEPVHQDSTTPRRQWSEPDAAQGTIRAPMPGLVSKVKAEEGRKVRKGEGLVAVEAMKMEHEMRAPFDAIVKKVRVRAGQQVDAFQPLVELDPGS